MTKKVIWEKRKYDCADQHCKTAADALFHSFTWKNSPEGSAFWVRIQTRLAEIANSPDREFTHVLKEWLEEED